MKKSILAFVMAFLPAICAAQGAAPNPCSELTLLRLPDVRVVSAMLIEPAPTWTPSAMDASIRAEQVKVTKPFCRVRATIEREINFELWLPSPQAWSGRFFGTGNGGFAGFIRYEELARGVNRDLASVSTDTGHTATELHWALGEPQRLDNYGHRGQHLVAVNAKKITELYYKRPINKAYFMGCSGGGMQAMNEAQLHPGDYNGIIAGAAGTTIAGISARWLRSALIYQDDQANSPTPADWKKMAEAAVTKCDAADGVKDGVINDPQACTFSLAETPGITGARLKHAEELYGPVMGNHGVELFAGFAPGVTYFPLTSPGDAGEMFSDWTYQDRTWDPHHFDPARDEPLAEATTLGLATRDPNLRPFEQLGGKLIAYQGWTDPIVPALSTIGYHEDVAHYLGRDEENGFFRLFMAPGMNHCGGGDGPSHMGAFMDGDGPSLDAEHDLLSALMKWVEQGKAPDQVIASKTTAGKVTMTRPLCPYPAVAKYKGSGDTNVAANFACAEPDAHPAATRP